MAKYTAFRVIFAQVQTNMSVPGFPVPDSPA